MSIIKYRWFWAWDFDKEEKWLNEMSKNGLQLREAKLIRYKFDEGKENEYTYRIEMLDELPSTQKSQDYLRFLEETGVERISSYIRWVYLRKRKSDGEFDLFTDLDSRISHLTKIMYFIAVIIPIELVCAVNLWFSFTAHNEVYSLIFALLSSIIVVLATRGVYKIYNHRKKMKEERCLHE